MTKQSHSRTSSSCGCFCQTCIRSSQPTFQHGLERASCGVLHLGAVDSFLLLGEGESVFFNGVISGRMTMLQ
ncbi:hypothetical protein U0070_008788 [Myodes glareolus]|uniref:Uncharacterized protein n=1 Tax=Myodes glareolus TaxID=447135 RepID=A0AAW0I409_MYOGA